MIDSSCGVYKIRNLENGKYYIGSTKNLRKRRSNHFGKLKSGGHCNPHLQNSFNKHGEESFRFEVIVKCDESRQYKYEQYWLDRVDNFDDAYNISKDATSSPSGSNHYRWEGGKVSLECEWCGSVFKVKKSKEENAKFCSEGCYGKWKSEYRVGQNNSKFKDRIEVKCENCEDNYKVRQCEVEDSRFCTHSCFLEWQSENFSGEDNPMWEGGKVKLNCSVCGASFKVRQFRSDSAKYCSIDCRSKEHTGSSHPRSKLDSDEVKQIKRLLEGSDKTQKEIGNVFDVSSSAIADIKHGRNWSHIEV